MLLRKKESQDLKQSDLMQQQKIDQLMSNSKKPKKFQNSRGSVSPVFRLTSSSLSSADLSQPVVCLGVGDDGLNGHDGLVDLGLEHSQLLDVQQAQDLSRLIQSGIWEEIRFRRPSQSNIFLVPLNTVQTPRSNNQSAHAVAG